MTGDARWRGDPSATPLVLAGALLAGFWPVWRWYVARMSDGSDEPLGLFALVTAAVFLPRTGWKTGTPVRGLVAAAVTLAIYVAAFEAVPPLVRAMLAMITLACVIPREAGRPMLPLLALLLLSLPVIATLQFFLGYPLRALTAWCCARALGFAGLAVQAEGTTLRWAAEEILIDAPCSGIRMLWMVAFLSSTLAAAQRLPAWRFVRLAQLTAALVFAANVIRSFVLFFLETGLWPNPSWAHEAVGLSVFAGTAGGCLIAAHALRPASAVPDNPNRSLQPVASG